MNNKNLQLLGLANRAKKILTGETAMEAIKSLEASLVIYASDASAKTKKRIIDKCNFYNVEVIEFADSLAISNALGKNNCMYVAIIDKGFAQTFVKNLK